MDMNGKYDFGFSIDEIFLDESSRKIFGLRLIPDFNSQYFPPYHTRVVYVPSEYLSKEFYSALSHKNEDLKNVNENQFKNIVEQGGYYRINKEEFSKKVHIFEYQNEEFFSNKEKSPYSDDKHNVIKDIKELNQPSSKFGDLYIYCFNVGQGDSFLLIFPNGSVYVIDTNIYYGSADRYVNCVKRILSSHNLPIDKIKAIFFTHKHLDHIRGASFFMRHFKIEYFVINLDYTHPTRPVDYLFNTARQLIPVWVNCNKESQIFEGDTKIDIRNPDADTSCKDRSPDINDSSICLYIRHGNNRVYLTGDAGYPIINRKYTCSNTLLKQIYDNLLKVSHHGSHSGTNYDMLNNLKPSHCFISAGNSAKYNHPSQHVMDLLNSHRKIHDVKISKFEQRNICYVLNGTDIQII